jgi:hypothetical protein
VKRCPTCNKTFTDRNLSFCIDDGTPLVPVETPPDEETVVTPSASGGPRATGYEPPNYQPPGSYSGAGAPAGPKRRVWPWVVGLVALVLVMVVGLGIAAAILISRSLRSPSVNVSNRNANVSQNGNYNSNRNSSSASDNSNVAPGKDTAAPTDEAQVLIDLTDLENEWTVANINADKNKLDRILADDYVGTSSDGETQGKAEYLRTIERDTLTQKWEFEDMDVDLNGDRATLTGVVRFETKDQEAVYRFTDKFVWRDGRWQATSSEVTQVK